MKITIEADEDILSAVRAGVADALRSPEFIRAVVAQMAPELFWCTYEQAREFAHQSESKWDRWVADHRRPGADGCPALIISTGSSAKIPLVRLDSLQAVLNFHAPAVPRLNGAAALEAAATRR